ncbi:MAG: proton-conducting transporter membrane subunit, partial [Acidobacteria bacterium]|nr:proton-conducting transporter membrane subunit [Acidobacteriota bacterium]
MIEANLPLLVPLSLLIPALLIPLIGLRVPGAAYPLALAAVLASIPIAGFGLFRVIAGGPLSYTLGGWEAPIGIELVLDPLASFLTLVVTVVSCLVLIHARQVASVEHPDKRIPYYSLVLLLLAGFCGILSTGDLFNLYVFLEISSLAGYGLVAIGDKRSPVAAYRYLILGSVGTGFYLLGIGFIYVMSGSLNMADLARILPHILDQPTVLAGLILTVTGIGLKMALFPLHFWLPDAYSSASSATSALLAPLGTKVGAYILIRVLFFVFDPAEVEQRVPIASAIAWLSAGGVLYGSIMALAQQELQRILD